MDWTSGFIIRYDIDRLVASVCFFLEWRTQKFTQLKAVAKGGMEAIAPPKKLNFTPWNLGI